MEQVMQDLRFILQKNGFTFKKRLGQNFLSDEEILGGIASAAGIDENSTVVEIGPGAGTLTRELAKSAKKVYCFEIDKSLTPVLRETLAGIDNAEVIFKDFLKVNLEEFEAGIGEYTVVANLPYYITTPLIMKLIEESKKAERLVVMVQEEVAARFCAEADTPDYGAITAAIALRGECSVAMRVPRTKFYPQPNVDSAVVKIDITEGRIRVKDRKTYRDTVRCAFLSRRKTLENNLVNSFSFSREQAKKVLSEAGIEEKTRGEALSPERLAALSDIIYDMKR